MKNKIMFLVLFSFAFMACDELMDHHDNYNDDDNELLQIMKSMSHEMDKMTMTMDPDHDFAMMMKAHHQGAVDMAVYELEHGNDNEMKHIAKEMKDMQRMEIAQLDSFMQSHEMMMDSVHGKKFMEASHVAMKTMDMKVKRQYLNGDSDHDFAALMIHHHRSAIEMADAIIEHGHDKELKAMATNMKEDQLNEIEEVQEWLKDNY